MSDPPVISPGLDACPGGLPTLGISLGGLPTASPFWSALAGTPFFLRWRLSHWSTETGKPRGLWHPEWPPVTWEAHPPILPDRAVVGGGVGGLPLAALALAWTGSAGAFPPLLRLLPLSLPHLRCLALVLPLLRRPVEVLIDLSLPEEEVAPDILEGIGEGGALVHHLVDLSPRVALCKEQGGVSRGGLLPAMSSP